NCLLITIPLQVFQQASQLLRFPSKLIALEVRDLKEPWQSLIEIRPAQDLLDLLANPFVIGNGVGPARDEESLEELAESVIEEIEGLEIQPTCYEKGDVIEIIDAK